MHAERNYWWYRCFECAHSWKFGSAEVVAGYGQGVLLRRLEKTCNSTRFPTILQTDAVAETALAAAVVDVVAVVVDVVVVAAVGGGGSSGVGAAAAAAAVVVAVATMAAPDAQLPDTGSICRVDLKYGVVADVAATAWLHLC